MRHRIEGQEFYLIVCHSCGISFLIPDKHDDSLRESHETFWCPTGHDMSYTHKTEEEKLRKQLRETKKYAAAECVAKTEAYKRAYAAERSNAALKGHLTRIKRAKGERP